MVQVLGIVEIVWRGRLIPVEKGAKVKPSGIKNTAVVYGTRVDRAQEYVGGEVTATTHLRRGERLSDLVSPEEGELQVRCDTGQVFVSRAAFLTEMPEATGGEGGKIELKWAGVFEEIEA
jgi:hypothetical protein